ncbi:MAG: hypothetical protein LBS18_02235, partial [Clostridiales bacterium]|jgi:hypothetical protein|nr:hypothetical protein [Clostridiales bacterium]
MALSIGCGNAQGGAAQGPFDGKTLETVMDEIYAGAGVDIPSLGTIEITAENETAFLGTSGIKFSEAIASEPMIGAVAYSVCLVRVQPGEDIEKVKQSIKENANPSKWICVNVDESNVIVDSAGDVIILVMTNEYAKSIHDSFVALKG